MEHTRPVRRNGTVTRIDLPFTYKRKTDYATTTSAIFTRATIDGDFDTGAQPTQATSCAEQNGTVSSWSTSTAYSTNAASGRQRLRTLQAAVILAALLYLLRALMIPSEPLARLPTELLRCCSSPFSHPPGYKFCRWYPQTAAHHGCWLHRRENRAREMI